MRIVLSPILLTTLAMVSWAATLPTLSVTLQERFVVNAQYRGAVTQTFKDMGKGTVTYRKGQGTVFGLEIAGSLKNPETKELWKMQVNGDFQLTGSSIERLTQKIDLSKEAKRYEEVVTHNLPFVYLARFQPLPKGPEPEEVPYRYEGRDYVLRYVTVENVVEATLFESGVMIGKFFLHGDYGRPPKGLVKGRMGSANHIVFSLVLDRTTGTARAGGD